MDYLNFLLCIFIAPVFPIALKRMHSQNMQQLIFHNAERFKTVSLDCHSQAKEDPKIHSNIVTSDICWFHSHDPQMKQQLHVGQSSSPHPIKDIKLNSVALVRERTILTERPPLVGEVSANFCGSRGVTWSAQRVPTAINLFSRPGAATF